MERRQPAPVAARAERAGAAAGPGIALAPLRRQAEARRREQRERRHTGAGAGSRPGRRGRGAGVAARRAERRRELLRRGGSCGGRGAGRARERARERAGAAARRAAAVGDHQQARRRVHLRRGEPGAGPEQPHGRPRVAVVQPVQCYRHREPWPLQRSCGSCRLAMPRPVVMSLGRLCVCCVGRVAEAPSWALRLRKRAC